MLLPKVEMNAASMIEGKQYLWRIDEDRTVVVWLNKTKDGLEQYEDEYCYEWWFEDNLIGDLFGPFELAL